MLLLPDSRLDERRRATHGPLAPLYDSLASELEPFVGKTPYIPDAKALLSRAGGRCELDGAALVFDPSSPEAHRCPVCGTVYKGVLHHRAWITSYQLWLAERAVQAALFHLLRGDARHAAFARDILHAYAERYLRYPNQDNVLGPTRLFFSTYLESIWLLQICVAADLLERAGDAQTADVVRDRIVEPSGSLIAEYDEGMSNRQVWNNAALLACAALGDDSAAADRIVGGVSGLSAHLSDALLVDGTWYEGENYHQFALRGLWYATTIAETFGHAPDPALLSRFQRAFATPFLTALPDFTMPSRKDSQYAVSLRQWRIAELTELGFARSPDPVLNGALARLYDGQLERRETGRATSTADVERNGPASSLTRADLGWRALLHALPELPPLRSITPRSALLEGQGVAVFRRADDVYVALDYGQSGGGHGHPDRLNVLLSQSKTRWLDDLGTGSYVDPSLHWYRSTLAHNAPLVNGRSQPLRDGVLLAHDEREGLGWVVAEFLIPESFVRVERMLVVAPEYVIDQLRWTAPQMIRLDLPWHLDGSTSIGLGAMPLDGGDGPEDGFSFVRDPEGSRVTRGTPIELRAEDEQDVLRATFVTDQDGAVLAAYGPGQPATSSRRFYVLRAEGTHGAFSAMLTWTANVLAATFFRDSITIECAGGERHVHRRDAAGWHVEMFANAARSSVDLGGFRPAADQRQARPPAPRNPTMVRRTKVSAPWLSEMSGIERGALVTHDLGEKHYRRSEDRWSAAGSPRATIALGATGDSLIIYAMIEAGTMNFAPGDARNSYDNEHPDTMAAGIQLYLRTPDGRGGWMLVPEIDAERVRARPIPEWGTLPEPVARWRPWRAGYEVRIAVRLPDSGAAEYPVDVDLIVNETTAGRERRRGQLVVSGAHGEFVYLRGDRHDVDRLMPLVIVS